MAQNPTSGQVYAYYGAQSTGKGVIYDALGNAIVIGAQMPVGAGAGKALVSDASGNLTPGTVGAASLPAATTTTQGAVILDGTASDIANTGTQAAGSTGKAADAGHVHFSSGMYLCAPSMYAPSVQVTLSTASATLVAPNCAPTTVAAGSNGGQISLVASWAAPSPGVLAVASTAGYPSSGTLAVAASGATTAVVTYTGTSGGTQFTGCAYVSGSPSGTVSTGGAVTLTSVSVNTGAFTAPPSGSVIVTVTGIYTGASNDNVSFALAAHGTVSPVVGFVVTGSANSSANCIPPAITFPVTGLTPGTSYNFDLLFAIASAGTLAFKVIGQTSVTPTATLGAPLTMTVQAV